MLEFVLTVHVARDETMKAWPFHRFGRAGSRETRQALISAIAASDKYDVRRGFDRWELIRALFAALIIEGLVDDVAEGREPDLETAHRNLLADCAKEYPMFVGVRAAGNKTISEIKKHVDPTPAELAGRRLIAEGEDGGIIETTLTDEEA